MNQLLEHRFPASYGNNSPFSKNDFDFTNSKSPFYTNCVGYMVMNWEPFGRKLETMLTSLVTSNEEGIQIKGRKNKRKVIFTTSNIL